MINTPRLPERTRTMKVHSIELGTKAARCRSTRRSSSRSVRRLRGHDRPDRPTCDLRSKEFDRCCSPRPSLAEIPQSQVVEVKTHADVAVRRPPHLVQDAKYRDVVVLDVLGESILARRR